MTARPLHALLACAALALPASAQILSIDFDDDPAPALFDLVVPGPDSGPLLVFPGVTLEGGVILNDSLFDDAATTGSNILASCDTCLLGGIPPTGLPGVITGTFDPPVNYVELSLSNGQAQPVQLSLELFNEQGVSLGGVTSSMAAFGELFDTQTVGTGVSGDVIKSFTLQPLSISGYTFAMDSLRFGDEPGGWGYIGQGLAGVNGVPFIAGFGDLVAESENVIVIESGVPNGDVFLVVGLTQIGAPFKGGVLIPSLDLLVGPVPLNPVGQVDIEFEWPSGLPPFTTILMQAWLPDAAGPVGFSSSAGLVATGSGN